MNFFDKILKRWQQIISGLCTVGGIALMIVGACQKDPSIGYALELTASITLTIDFSLTITFTIYNINNGTIVNIDDHSKQKNVVKAKTDSHDKTIDKSKDKTEFNNKNCQIGVQAQSVGSLSVNMPPKAFINENEKKHFDFITKNLDKYIAFADNPFNEPLDNYLCRGVDEQGNQNNGDLEPLFMVKDYCDKQSVKFNNDELNRAFGFLRAAVNEFLFNLSFYTHPYGKEQRKEFRMWSLDYVISVHPHVYTVEEKYGEIDDELREKAKDQIHLLQHDYSELKYKYDSFASVYNGLL